MTGKKKNRYSALSSAHLSEPDAPRDTTTMAMGASPDVSALATILSADYPLLDQSLIMAIMLDHDSSSLLSQLPHIREQLGILEATMVPDADEILHSNPPHSDHSNFIEDELVHSTSSLGISSQTNGKARSSPLSRTSTTDSLPRLTGGRESNSTETSPTSVTEDEGGEAYQDELALLHELFPTVPMGQVKEALSVEPSLPAAIDHLLSLELIKDVETRGEWPDEVITDNGEIKHVEEELLPPFMPDLAIVSSHPPRKAARSKRNKQITVPLVDTLKRTSSQLPSPSSSRGQSPSRKAPPSRSIDNAWGTMASLAAHLSDLLSPSAHYFLSYLHSAKYYSPYSAVRASLVAIPGSAAVKEDVRSKQVLQEMYGLSLGEGSLQTQNDLELCAKVAGGDVATVMDLMDLLSEIGQWAGDDDLDRYDQYSKSATSSPVGARVTLLPPSPDVHMATLSDAEDHAETTKTTKNPNLMTRRPKARERNPEDDALFRTELMMRPGTKTTNLLKDRIIPGAKAADTSSANPTAHDNFGATSSSFSAPMGRSKSHPGKQVHPQNWRHVNHIQERQRRNGELHPYASHIPSYARGALPHDSTPGALYTTVHSGDLTIEECLRRAQAEREKRESSVRLAGKHFKLSGSKSTNGSVSGAYATRARESADAARVWELRAAQMVVMSRLEQTGHTIDLHNLTIMEAKEVVLQAAERWWEKEKAKAKFSGFPEGASSRPRTFVPGRGLTVITGVGRHSAGKMGVLGPAVANALEQNGWRVERGERSRGYLMVQGKMA